MIEALQGLIAYAMDLVGVPEHIVEAFRAFDLFAVGGAWVASLGTGIVEAFPGLTGRISDKIDGLRAAFDDGLLNGVFKALSTLNPFALALAGLKELLGAAMGLLGVPDEIVEAFHAFSLYDTGLELMRSLWDGMAALVPQMVAAISDKLSGIMPAWMKDAWAWVAGGEEPPAFDALPPEQQAAVSVLHQSVQVGDLPTERHLAELETAANAQRQAIAELETSLAQTPVSDSLIRMPDWREAKLENAKEQLAAITQEQATATEHAEALQNALMVIEQTDVRPDIDATAIDLAIEKAAELDRLLRSAGRTVVPLIQPATVPAAATSDGLPLAGTRDHGGPVRPGLPYQVGERGMEIFVPDIAGMILPTRVAQAAALASSMAMPDAAMPSPQEIALRVDSRPQMAAPVAPSQIIRQGDTISITIAPPPGADPHAIARAVRAELERMQDARRADLHDGVDY